MDAHQIAECIDEEDLQLELEEAQNEVVELHNELRASKIERDRLQACLRVEEKNRTIAWMPGTSLSSQARQVADLRKLVDFLALHVNFSLPENLEVGHELPCEGRKVRLASMIQWPLGRWRLRLSAPMEHAGEVEELVAAARTGRVEAAGLERFAAEWSFSSMQLQHGVGSWPEPTVVLARRDASDLAIIVGPWPTKEALARALTARRAADRAAGRPLPGERVEVELDGKWLPGTLQTLDITGKAFIRCDDHTEGVLTVAPITYVRRLPAEADQQRRRFVSEDAFRQIGDQQPAAGGRRLAGHRRTQSAM